MKTETWVRLAAIGVCAVTAGVIGYVLVRYLAGILLPFFAAAVFFLPVPPPLLRALVFTVPVFCHNRSNQTEYTDGR